MRNVSNRWGRISSYLELYPLPSIFIPNTNAHTNKAHPLIYWINVVRIIKRMVDCTERSSGGDHDLRIVDLICLFCWCQIGLSNMLRDVFLRSSLISINFDCLTILRMNLTLRVSVRDRSSKQKRFHFISTQIVHLN